MELKDLIVTPIVFLFILVVAYVVRPYVSSPDTRPYFFPALILKMVCAILLGVLYQFYYNGGDTFLYHTQGSAVVYEALKEEPTEGLKLIFFSNDYGEHPYRYISRIRYFGDSSAYMVVRIAAIFDIFTFSSYSATALLFGALSFSGLWLLFLFFQKNSTIRPFTAALCILFIPSVLFWGSGILKDSLTIAALGWFLFSLHKVFIDRKRILFYSFIMILALYILYELKLYILLCLLPSAIVYLFLVYLNKIRPAILKYMLGPLVIISAGVFGYLALQNLVSEESKYSLDRLAETAKVTAYDIAYWTGKGAGSTYSLGELDGTFEGMVKLAPEAVNVSIFRPYIWEVRNPLMLMSALESLLLFLYTVFLLFKSRILRLRWVMRDPLVVFCLLFSLAFAFGVGVSTYNFGTLSRYRIPMLPFYLMGLMLIENSINARLRMKQI